MTALETALHGLYNQLRFLQLTCNFTAFDGGPDGLSKRIAKPHQYFAVTKAVGSTIQAVASNGKAGVVWHTQGSGKSMEMELYANLVARSPQLKNPTVVVITDRNELDGQLFEGFDRSLLLAESPKQIRKRSKPRTPAEGQTAEISEAPVGQRRPDHSRLGARHPADHHGVGQQSIPEWQQPVRLEV